MKVSLELDRGLAPYILAIESAGVYGNFGPQVTEMEREFARFLGVPAATLVSVANATVGLQGAMKVLGFDRWVVPSWTFAATAHAAKAISSDFCFGDAESFTWTLGPSQVQTSEAAVVTAPFGSQIEIGADWNHVAGVVVDAAASVAEFPIFAKDFVKPWAAVISLHATKILGIGEGGLVIFRDEEAATEFRRWTNFGFAGSRSAEAAGTNAKLSELHAAVGRYRLAQWATELPDWQIRRSRVHFISEGLGVSPPFSEPDLVSPYWICWFKDREERLAAEVALGREGFETRKWWGGGCHQMPAFSGQRSVGSLGVTDQLAETSLGLPFYRNIPFRVLDKIGSVLRSVIE